MPVWDVHIDLDPESHVPIFLQIGRRITEGIRIGRLRAGQKLPGTRTLAQSLGVHRNTVIAAYDELISEGWLTTNPAGGTFVANGLPTIRPRAFAPSVAMPPVPGFAFERTAWPAETPMYPPGTLVLKSGMPDLRLLPHDLLGRAYRRALRVHGDSLMDYGDSRGHERLRIAIADMLASLRGLAIGPEGILVTRGSQHALDLIARTIIRPGDAVAIEAQGYLPAWQALRAAGARLIPVPVDDQGICVDDVADLADGENLRAVYLTPHHQYPTTRTLVPSRRLQLLTLARQRRWAVIEDDYDYEFHYDGRPIMPLASADSAGVVVYVGTLSKILAPGLRLGFVAAPQALIDEMALVRRYNDRQGDLAVECAVASLIEDRDLQRHANAMRRAYRSRRDALAAAIHRHLGDAVRFTVPSGGMAMWVEAADGIDLDAWSERAAKLGAGFAPGRRYRFDGAYSACARWGFSPLTEDELDEAVRRLAEALP